MWAWARQRPLPPSLCGLETELEGISMGTSDAGTSGKSFCKSQWNPKDSSPLQGGENGVQSPN